MSSANSAPAGHGHALSCYDRSASVVATGGGYCNGAVGKIAVHGSYPSDGDGWTVSCLAEATVTVVVRCCDVH